MKDWSRHSNTLVILLLENKTKQNQERCFFLPSSYWKYLSSLVLIFMFYIVFKFIQWPGQLTEGVWEFAGNTVLGSVRKNWHQRTHSYLCRVKTTLSVAFFISEVSRAGLQPAPLPSVARGTVWNGMRRQCREPRCLSVPLSSVDATLPSSRIPANWPTGCIISTTNSFQTTRSRSSKQSLWHKEISLTSISRNRTLLLASPFQKMGLFPLSRKLKQPSLQRACSVALFSCTAILHTNVYQSIQVLPYLHAQTATGWHEWNKKRCSDRTSLNTSRTFLQGSVSY